MSVSLYPPGNSYVMGFPAMSSDGSTSTVGGHILHIARGTVSASWRGVAYAIPFVRDVVQRNVTVPVTGQQFVQTKGLSTVVRPDLTLPVTGNSLVVSQGSVFVQVPAKFVFDGVNVHRWATEIYNNLLWFTNDDNPVMFTDGTSVKRYAAMPSGRYLMWFFDHLMLGRPTVDGAVLPFRVQWSDLYRPSVMAPKDTNEADYFDFVEDPKDLPICGVTGLGKLDDVGYVFTASMIVPFQYVGLPKIMKFGPFKSGIGNSLPYGLAQLNDSFLFWDSITNNFYRFDGQDLQPIGAPIRKYVLDTISPDVGFQLQTYANHVPEFSEVEWIFMSKDSLGTYDQAVVYNYRANIWYTRAVENVFCSGSLGSRSTTCDQLVGACNALLGECEDLGFSGEPSIGRVYGTGTGQLLRDAVQTDTVVIDPGVKPELISKDFSVDYERFVDLDTITIHASSWNNEGVHVFLSVRSYLDDDIVWIDCGTWTSLLPENRLTFPKISGRIFRWRFVFNGTPPKGCTFKAYVDNLLILQAEK